MSEQLRPKLLRAEQSVTQSWEWPDLENHTEVAAQIALNQVERAMLEPEIIEEENLLPPAPPTLEEIEAIRDEAYQDGFAEGRDAGESKGFEQGRLKGIEQGYNEGYQQGLEQGLEAGDTQISARQTQWDQLLNELTTPLQALDDQIERELVTLAMRLAQAVVQVELKTSPQAVLEALRLGAQALPSQRQQVEIHLNEQDKTLVQESFGDEALTQRQWQLVLDPALNPGSLLLTTERSQVAMFADERLQNVLENFSSRPRTEVDEPHYPHYHTPAEQDEPAESLSADNESGNDSLEDTAEPALDPQIESAIENVNDHSDPQ